MNIEVTVKDASLGDVVETVCDEYGEQVGQVTLGEVVVQALLDQLTRDPRWEGIAQRFWDAVDAYLLETAPDHAAELVKAEVARQLADTGQGARTRGAASTRAEAIVATEVTTQLRAQFAPLVERALNNLARDLQTLSGDAVDAFRKGAGR